MIQLTCLEMDLESRSSSSSSSEFDHRMCLNPVYGTNLV